MKEIGGFFELELASFPEYHENAIALNSGRNCLEYIIIYKKYKKIHVPYFICNSVINKLTELGVEIEFYHIDSNFAPEKNFYLSSDEALLYVNYYGLCDSVAHQIGGETKNIILDNTQSFFYKPTYPIDCFYSPRKFFGVPDGGYLYTSELSSFRPLEQDKSFNRCFHLLNRIDASAESSYSWYKDNEILVGSLPLRTMSKLTKSILGSINYADAIHTRFSNFCYLNERLAPKNILNMEEFYNRTPFAYPLYIEDDRIKEYLIKNNIYVPTYWNEVLSRVSKDSIEYKYTKYIVPLPVDHRYDLTDMQHIVDLIEEII